MYSWGLILVRYLLEQIARDSKACHERVYSRIASVDMHSTNNGFQCCRLHHGGGVAGAPLPVDEGPEVDGVGDASQVRIRQDSLLEVLAPKACNVKHGKS